jgi:hemerythrin
MKAKKSDAEAFQKFMTECEEVTKTVTAQIENIGRMLKDITKNWFEAAHQ